MYLLKCSVVIVMCKIHITMIKKFLTLLNYIRFTVRSLTLKFDFKSDDTQGLQRQKDA